MPINPNLEVPTFIPIVQSDTTIIHPTLRGVDIWAAGTIKLGDVIGNTYGPYTCAAPFPIRLTGQINMIYDTGTSIANADIVGLQ